MLYVVLWSVSGAAIGALAGWLARDGAQARWRCETAVGALVAPLTAALLCWRLRIDVFAPGPAAGSLWSVAVCGAAVAAMLCHIARQQLPGTWPGVRKALRAVRRR